MATEVEVEVVTTEEESGVQIQENASPAPQEESKKRGLRLRRKGSSENKEKSRKPPGNKWLQQQIPACRPVFTASHVFVAFVIVGLVFLALGIAFTVVSIRLRELEIPYTNCINIDNSTGTQGCEDYLDNLQHISNFERAVLPDCHCEVSFRVTEPLRPSWYIYYSMDNYFQNHRRYLNSWDVDQLRGEDFDSPTSDCRPITQFTPLNESQELPVVLCGLIANSFFNDSLDVFNSTDSSISVEINRTNIAWNSDRTVRFQNPGGADELDSDSLVGTTMPPNWPQNLSSIPRGLQNESLMVWFRVSAFPWFRKLYGRPEVNGAQGELPVGNYTISLTYNYPVRPFGGRKSIILAEVSWLGGRNLFIGIAYIITGALLIIVAIVLLLIGVVFSRWKTTDKNFLKRSY